MKKPIDYSKISKILKKKLNKNRRKKGCKTNGKYAILGKWEKITAKGKSFIIQSRNKQTFSLEKTLDWSRVFP